MDSSFRQHLCEFAPLLLAPDKLVVKTINGAPLTGKTLYNIFGVSYQFIVHKRHKNLWVGM